MRARLAERVSTQKKVPQKSGIGGLSGLQQLVDRAKKAQIPNQLASDDPRIQGRPAPQQEWAGQQQAAGAKDPKPSTEGDRWKGYAANQAMNYGPKAASFGAQVAGLLPGQGSSLPAFVGPLTTSGSPAMVAATSGGAAAPSALGTLGAITPWLGLGGQALSYGMQGYDAAKSLTDSTAANDASGGVKGALLSGGPMTAWAAPLVDVVGIKSGKHKDQYQRDSILDYLKGNNFLGQDNKIKLAGGGTFDLGDETIDGLGTLNNKSYNINWDDPRTHELVGSIQPLVDMMIGNSSDKRTSDLTGKLVNAALASGDMSMDSVRGFYEQAGFDREKAAAAVAQMASDAQRLPPDRRDAYLAAIDKLFPGGASTSSGGASKGESKKKKGGSKKPTTAVASPITPPSFAPPVAPVPGAPTDYGQALLDVRQRNTSDPINAQLNPLTASPFTMRRIPRRV